MDRPAKVTVAPPAGRPKHKPTITEFTTRGFRPADEICPPSRRELEATIERATAMAAAFRFRLSHWLVPVAASEEPERPLPAVVGADFEPGAGARVDSFRSLRPSGGVGRYCVAPRRAGWATSWARSTLGNQRHLVPVVAPSTMATAEGTDARPTLRPSGPCCRRLRVDAR
jgi:hypothetical protein